MSKYTIICWPDVQLLMDKPGFDENSNLVTSDSLLDQYGSSAYFVNSDWIEELEQEEINEYSFRRLKKYTIWEEETFVVEATSLEEAEKIVMTDPEDFNTFDSDYEYLYDTMDKVTVEDNGGEATVEVFNENEVKIWSNV